MVAYAVAAAKAFWLAAAKLSARWGAVTAMSKAVGELAKLGTKMSAGRRPEATSRVFAVEGGQSFFSGFRPATSSHHASRSRIA